MSKRQLLAWHRRIGLVCALFLVLQGLTGAVLAWRAPMERLLAPELRLTPSPRPALLLERQIELARTAAPGAVLLRATWPEDDSTAPRFLFDADGHFFMLALDSRSGVVLRKGGLARWPVEFALRLHANLIAGSIGHFLVGLDGAALAILVALGWRLWWPGRKRLHNGLTIVHGAGTERFLRSLHRSAGSIGAFLLLCAGVTGTVLCWLPQVQPRFDSEDTLAPEATLDMALKSWSSRHDHARPARFIFERDAPEPVRIDWSNPGTAFPIQTTLRKRTSRRQHLCPTIQFPHRGVSAGVARLHSGRIIEPLGRLVALAIASLLVGLSGTGTWIWWRYSRSRGNSRARI
jgi:uncharacterized iron-regulated membrane protein